MLFRDRQHAAELLAESLVQYKGMNPLVLGIPRGGVVMALAIARALEGEADVVLVRKIGHPMEPEVAIGSVDERGTLYRGDLADQGGIPPDYIEMEKVTQLNVLRQRRAMYTPVREPISPEGRHVIVVDDGLATGATMIAALRAVREARPARLVAAAGVAPPSTLETVQGLADDVVCLEVPLSFFAVGQYYMDFSQVSDEEVIEILSRERREGKKT